MGYRFEEPKYDQRECLDRDMTYAAPLYVSRYWNKEPTNGPPRTCSWGIFL